MDRPPRAPLSAERLASLARAREKAAEVRRAMGAESQRARDDIKRTKQLELEVITARRAKKEKELAALVSPPKEEAHEAKESEDEPVDITQPVESPPHDDEPPPPPPQSKGKAKKKAPPPPDSSSDSEEDYATPPKRKGQPKHLAEYWRAKTELLNAQAEFHRQNAAQLVRKEVHPMSHEAATLHVAKGVIRNKAQENYRAMAWNSLFPGQPFPEGGW